MLGITDIKVGTVFSYQGSPQEAIFVQHSKLGRGGAILRTKLRNLKTGAIIDVTFKGSDKFDSVDTSYKPVQYLYQDGQNFVFMDNQSYEQLELSSTVIAEKSKFLKEGTDLNITFIDGQPMGIQLPIKMDFEVTYTEPGFRGDTQSATFKPATLETGATVQVPLFINIGDKIRLDTRTSTYVERAN